jgi:hypothetical protein
MTITHSTIERAREVRDSDSDSSARSSGSASDVDVGSDGWSDSPVRRCFDHTRGRPEAQEQPLEPRTSGDGECHAQPAVVELLDRFDGVLLGHPAELPRELEGDARGVLGRSEQAEVTLLVGAVEGRVEQRRRLHAVDAEDAIAFTLVAVGLDVPLALVRVHAVGIDDSVGVLVAAVGVVVELDLMAGVDGPAKDVEGGRGGIAEVDVDRRGIDAEHGGHLRGGAGQRTLGIGPGSGRQASAGRDDGETLVGRHAERVTERVGELHRDAIGIHDDVDETVRAVRVHPHHPHDVEVGEQLFARDVEAPAHLVDRRAFGT